MCGIIGMLKLEPNDKHIEELVAGLKTLEYRGYDSWGYAFNDKNGISVEKKTGRITRSDKTGTPNVLIGHTRWATHGGVTDQNAHPHTDCKEEIAIVHNGIIENYLELREELIQKGHTFKSQTDSEVIAHLFEESAGTLFERAKIVSKKIKGSFAIVAISSKHEKEMVAMKNESPLVVGLSDNCIMFASDPLAFLKKTNKAIYLSEGEIAHVKKDDDKFKLLFYNSFKDEYIKKRPVTIDWTTDGAELDNYPHYMLKEIFEQPNTLMAGLNVTAAEKLAGFIKNKKVIAIACGTARHATVIGKHMLNRIANYNLDVMMAHEFSYFVDNLDKEKIILAVSQSGETADVLECVRKAKQKGIRIISIVNVPSSTLARESEEVFYINCGPEIAVASTKAFTNQVLAFYLIASSLNNSLENATRQIEKMSRILQENLPYFDQKAREIAEYLKIKNHVYMLGRGVNFPLALEGALKLKEISYIHAEGMPAGELKHGTLALIEKGIPVVLLAPEDYTMVDTLNNGLETKARGAYIIGISNKAHPSFNIWVQIPKLDEDVLYPFLEVIPMQLIAYYTAVLLNRDVDRPRNLAKSVTVK